MAHLWRDGGKGGARSVGKPEGVVCAPRPRRPGAGARCCLLRYVARLGVRKHPHRGAPACACMKGAEQTLFVRLMVCLLRYVARLSVTQHLHSGGACDKDAHSQTTMRIGLAPAAASLGMCCASASGSTRTMAHLPVPVTKCRNKHVYKLDGLLPSLHMFVQFGAQQHPHRNPLTAKPSGTSPSQTKRCHLLPEICCHLVWCGVLSYQQPHDQSWPTVVRLYKTTGSKMPAISARSNVERSRHQH